MFSNLLRKNIAPFEPYRNCRLQIALNLDKTKELSSGKRVKKIDVQSTCFVVKNKTLPLCIHLTDQFIFHSSPQK